MNTLNPLMCFQATFRVIPVGNTATHARREIAPKRPKNTNPTSVSIRALIRVCRKCVFTIGLQKRLRRIDTHDTTVTIGAEIVLVWGFEPLVEIHRDG